MRNSIIPVAGIVALFVALFLCISAKSAEPDARLLNALVWVESSRNANAVGDNGKAIGLLQLHKIYVDDVNRILGVKKYSYADRWNPQKSVEMTVVYLKHYGHRYERLTGKKASYEVLAKIHNGGPNGWEKIKTNKYWYKVQRYL